MQFSKEFFEDEVREGFYVSGMMKREWAAQLEVLEEVAKVCEKHNIRWLPIILFSASSSLQPSWWSSSPSAPI